MKNMFLGSFLMVMIAGCGGKREELDPMAQFAIDSGLTNSFYRYSNFDCNSSNKPEDLPRGAENRTHSLQIEASHLGTAMRVVNLSKCGIIVDREILELDADSMKVKGLEYLNKTGCPEIEASDEEIADFTAERDWTYTLGLQVLKITDEDSICTAYIKQ